MKTKHIIHIDSSVPRLSWGTGKAPLSELGGNQHEPAFISVGSGKGVLGSRGSFLKEVAFSFGLKGGDTPSLGTRWQLGEEGKIHTHEAGQREQLQIGPRAMAVGCTRPVGQFMFCEHLGKDLQSIPRLGDPTCRAESCSSALLLETLDSSISTTFPCWVEELSLVHDRFLLLLFPTLLFLFFAYPLSLGYTWAWVIVLGMCTLSFLVYALREKTGLKDVGVSHAKALYSKDPSLLTTCQLAAWEGVRSRMTKVPSRGGYKPLPPIP